MTFFSFSSFGKDKRKSKSKQSASRPSTSNGSAYQGNSVSTITLHRPVPPPVSVQHHSPPPNRPWNGNSEQAMVVSQPHRPFPSPLSPPPRPNYGPPPRQNYGPPPSNHGVAWASSTNLPNPVYPSSGKPSTFGSALHLPSSVTGGLHAASASMSNLGDIWNQSADRFLDSSSALYDRMSLKMDSVITCMDEENFSGREHDLELSHEDSNASIRSTNQSLTTTSSKSNNFSKVWGYSNSRLPPYLPPVKLYLDTFPLLSLAARYSLSVYSKPRGAEKRDHVKESHTHGTKAMVMKSLPIDNLNTIVFAIRGTQTFMDWAVNFKEAPSAPTGFMDNPDNFCHTGFLQVAKAMIRPVAERLRELLQQDPSRGLASLLITGHSAGGAVAQLLYAHMTSQTVSSELTFLTGFFKRVHCVTFGAPPVSLFPLERPEGKQHHRSLFFAFANEGDPVVRADRAIVRSLLKLYVLPAPDQPCPIVCPIVNALVPGMNIGPTVNNLKKKKSMQFLKASSWSGPSPNDVQSIKPWKVPSSTLSLGGRIVLMREKYGGQGPEDIEASSVTDEMLREVVYGDPMYHTMHLYARRVEILALRAATARNYG